jgi:hypothetical protein
MRLQVKILVIMCLALFFQARASSYFVGPVGNAEAVIGLIKSGTSVLAYVEASQGTAEWFQGDLRGGNYLELMSMTGSKLMLVFDKAGITGSLARPNSQTLAFTMVMARASRSNAHKAYD